MGPALLIVIAVLTVSLSALLARASGAGKDWRWLRWPAAFSVLALGFVVATTEPWPHGLGLESCTDTVNPALQNDADARPQILETCEPQGATSAPVLLAMVAVLLLLAPEFSEFSVAGLVTLKRNVEKIEAQQQELRATTAGAMSQAEYAEALGKEAAGISEPVDAHIDAMSGRPPGTAPRTVDELAELYNRVRATMKPGAARTTEMTRIVTALEAATNTEDFDIAGHLRSDDQGKRLAAYAALHARPDPAYLPALLEALDRKDKPFGEYWALRAIRRVVSREPNALSAEALKQLERHHVQPGTDRAYEFARVLSAARGEP